MTPSTPDPRLHVDLIDHYDGEVYKVQSLSEAQRRAAKIEPRSLEWILADDDEWLAFLEDGDPIRFTVYL